MILWSKTASELPLPSVVKTSSLRGRPVPFTAPDLVIMGWKKKNSRKRSELLAFMAKFDKSEFLRFCSRNSKEKILQRLIEISSIRLFSFKSYRNRRRMKHSVHKSHKCVACGAPAQVLHHAILVSNGGPNRRENLLELCRSCHAEVHPWLKEQK